MSNDSGTFAEQYDCVQHISIDAEHVLLGEFFDFHLIISCAYFLVIDVIPEKLIVTASFLGEQ